MKNNKVHRIMFMLISTMFLVSSCRQLGKIPTSSPFTTSCETDNGVVRSGQIFDNPINEIDTDKYIENEFVSPSSCIHYDSGNDSYHKFPGVLTHYVGEDEFDEWIKNVKSVADIYATDKCCYEYATIVNFVEYFNIPQEDFHMLINNNSNLYYLSDYNLDIIYSGNEKMIQEYYTADYDQRSREDFFKRQNMYLLKTKLLWEVGYDKFDGWVEQKTIARQEILSADKSIKAINNDITKFTGDVRQWNIAEFVREFAITREDFENILNSLISENLWLYDINIDLLFNNDYRLDYLIENAVDAAIIDNMYSSNDGIFRDELIYQQIIEAINSGKDISIEEINKIIEIDRSNK